MSINEKDIQDIEKDIKKIEEDVITLSETMNELHDIVNNQTESFQTIEDFIHKSNIETKKAKEMIEESKDINKDTSYFYYYLYMTGVITGIILFL